MNGEKNDQNGIEHEAALEAAKIRVAELYDRLGLLPTLSGDKPQLPQASPEQVRNGL